MWYVASAGKRVAGGKRGKTYVSLVKIIESMVHCVIQLYNIRLLSPVIRKSLTEKIEFIPVGAGTERDFTHPNFHTFARGDVQNAIRGQAVKQ